MARTATWSARQQRPLTTLNSTARPRNPTWQMFPMGTKTLLSSSGHTTFQGSKSLFTNVKLISSGWTMHFLSVWWDLGLRNTSGLASPTKKTLIILCGRTKRLWSTLTGILECQVFNHYAHHILSRATYCRLCSESQENSRLHIRSPAGLRRFQDGDFFWPVGCAAVHQQDQVHLQTSGRGSSFNLRATNRSASSVRTWVDSAAIQKLLLQGWTVEQSFANEFIYVWIFNIVHSDLKSKILDPRSKNLGRT